MNTFNFKQLKARSKVHFIGVGGISMSALAQIMLSKGFVVSGSDINYTPIIKSLEGLGLTFHSGHNAQNVKDCDLVVYTAAVKADNPELKWAVENGISTIERPILLGAIMRDFKMPLAVSGTHGKTTTTSMLSYILIKLGFDPTVLVGGELDIIGGNIKTGNGQHFVAEACEYHRSFLSFFPYGATITNIEADHLDYFKDLEDVIAAFSDFARLVPEDGYIVACGDDKNVLRSIEGVKRRIITFGINNPECNITAKDISLNNGTSYGLYIDNSLVCEVSLIAPGLHNVLNSLAALANAYALGLDVKAAAACLEDFRGAGRRFEYKGTLNGAVVYDDYAHHPTEVKVTLSAARAKAKGRVICIYQPHTYSRTISLLKDFSTAFSDANLVIMADIYAAREIDEGIISSKMLCDMINNQSHNAIYIGDFDSIEAYILQNTKDNDLIITTGAGDIFKVADSLVK